MYSPITECRTCGNRELELVLDLGFQALTGVFPTRHDEHVPEGPLRLLKCFGPGSCGLVQLGDTFSSEQMYGDNYGYRSGLNDSMVRHLKSKVEAILDSFDVPEGAIVLDIGSNDGTTLAAYPKSEFHLVGIDPTADKFRAFYPDHVQVVDDFFSEATYKSAIGNEPAAVITSFSMFYDLDAPMTFMEEVRNVLSPEGIWVLEQSYLPLMLERNSYDTVCHEHLEYYALEQLLWMTASVGLTVIDVELNEINGGSFSVVIGKTGGHHRVSPRVEGILEREAALRLDRMAPYEAFADRVDRSRQSLLEFIEKARARGQSIGALGASTKGNVLLQFCGLTADDIVAVGEINADKIGSYTPGSKIPIISEDELIGAAPDYLLVLPWHFRQTFESKRLGVTTSLVFPLPELQVVGPSS